MAVTCLQFLFAAAAFQLSYSAPVDFLAPQVGRVPEVIQAEAELPNHLRYVCFQGRQEDGVQGGHAAQASKSVNSLSSMHAELIILYSGQSVQKPRNQPLIPGR